MQNMNDVNILDASAALAFLQREVGEAVVAEAFDTAPCWMSTANICEVMSKLCEKGVPADEARGAVDDLGVIARVFDAQTAFLAASIRIRTKAIGASLGDRACLAAAHQALDSHAVPVVYTAERAWAKLSWPFRITLLR